MTRHNICYHSSHSNLACTPDHNAQSAVKRSGGKNELLRTKDSVYSSVSKLHLYHSGEVRYALLRLCRRACDMSVHPGGRCHAAFEHSEASELTLNSRSHYLAIRHQIWQPEPKSGKITSQLTSCDNSLMAALSSEESCSPHPGEQLSSHSMKQWVAYHEVWWTDCLIPLDAKSLLSPSQPSPSLCPSPT